jgi:hypothetical protein
VCAEKQRLLVEYQKSNEECSASVGKMVARGISQSEYNRLCRETGKARERSIATRRRLARHIVDHGC